MKVTKEEYVDHAIDASDITVKISVEVDGEEIGYLERSPEAMNDQLGLDVEQTISDYFVEEYYDKLAGKDR